MLDSHLHVNDDALYGARREIIERAKENGVTKFLVVGWDYDSSVLAVQIAHEFDGVYAAVGVHPENLDGISDETLQKIKELADDEKVIAIGEIGLDHHWFKEEKDFANQREWFIKQIALANELHLPVSIHAREAVQETYDILKAHPIEKGAVLHCYSGSPEMLREFTKLGLYFGFDGPITYKNAIGPKECVQICPIDRILSETDSPYLSPVPYRGKTNEPAHIKEIVAQMAAIKEMSVEEIEKVIEDNFFRLFGK